MHPMLAKSQKCIPLVNLSISRVVEQARGGRGWLTEYVDMVNLTI